MKIDFVIILFFFIIGFIIPLLMFSLSYFLGFKLTNIEKITSYECGFIPFEDVQHNFDVRFYLVAILFIIFDLEITFLFPWTITIGSQTLFGFWTMMIFLLILTIGFLYEWNKGAIDWY